MARYTTGLVPDRPESRERDRDGFNFGATTGERLPEYAADVDFAQPIQWIRDQAGFPSCVGQTFAEIIDAELPGPTWASGVSIWREARRRQGQVEEIELGTRLEYAVEGLVKRGWDRYVEGEDGDPVEAGRGAPPAGDDLEDEMFAYDKRLASNLARYRLFGFGGALLDEVDEALRRGYGVAFGTGLREPFFTFVSQPNNPDQVLGLDYLGGLANPHAMRIAGRGSQDGRRRYLLQQSWGQDWGGTHLPSGVWQPGCCWVDEDVVVMSFDIHVIEIRA